MPLDRLFTSVEMCVWLSTTGRGGKCQAAGRHRPLLCRRGGVNDHNTHLGHGPRRTLPWPFYSEVRITKASCWSVMTGTDLEAVAFFSLPDPGRCAKYPGFVIAISENK